MGEAKDVISGKVYAIGPFCTAKKEIAATITLEVVLILDSQFWCFF